MNRRDFSRGVAGMAGLGLVRASHAQKQQAFAPLPFYDTVPKLVPIRAHEDRVFRGAGDGVVDSGFESGSDGIGPSQLRGALGGDGADFVRHVSELSGVAGASG